MAISYSLPTSNIIKNFAKPENFLEWLPGIFEKKYINNIFPYNTSADIIDDNLEFNKQSGDIDDFNLTLKRYYLFLYCLKSNPFLFNGASKVIDYKTDEKLFRPELREYLSKIQTNQIKNKINSSLTIELVKKYAIDNGLDLIPKNLSDFLKIAETNDFKNTVANNINVVTYESIIKHTLYEIVKQSQEFSYKESSSSGWINRAIALDSGEFAYFIDSEGGPDNKSFPVVCVLTKRKNKDNDKEILSQSNSFLTNIFGRDVNDSCLANILGEPDRFENNYKKIPILKGKKSDEFFYNSICLVYDFSKILLSDRKAKTFDTFSLLQISLGYLTKYSIEIEKIEDLESRKQVLQDAFEKYYPGDSFSGAGYVFSNVMAKKHAQEISNRINIFNPEQIEKSILNSKIVINKNNLNSSFITYVDNVINFYRQKRSENIQFSQYADKDIKIVLHFDSFFNLLAISSIPTNLKNQFELNYYSPFDLQNTFGSTKSFSFKEDEITKYLSDEYFNKAISSGETVKNYVGHRVCLITQTFEKLIFDNYTAASSGYYFSDKPNSDAIKKSSLKLYEKIVSTFPEKSNLKFENVFNTSEAKLLDKSIEFVNLSTSYRETKYQSMALQTMAFYLINATTADEKLNPTEAEDDKTDLKIFGESFHYPTLLMAGSTFEFPGVPGVDMFNKANEITVEIKEALENIAVDSEILLVPAEARRYVSLLKNSYEMDFFKEANDLIISSLPCYGDIVLLVSQASSIRNFEGFVNFVLVLFEKLPIFDMLASYLEKLLNNLIKLGESKQACLTLPKLPGFDPAIIYQGIEFLKDIFSSSFELFSIVKELVQEIPKLPIFDSWSAFFEGLLLFLLKVGGLIALQYLLKYLKPHLDKLCSLDYDWLDLISDKTQETIPDFAPRFIPDSFGNIAENGGALYEVQLNIDINTLIDLSKIQTREIVYNKFIEEFSLKKTDEILSEIQKFFLEISEAVDLYELASLLRNVPTEYTIKTLIDAISFSEISFKNLFSNEDGIRRLFVFLGNYCDYRICYDLLAQSLEKFAGNICSPQQSKESEYANLIKNKIGGGDPGKIIKDQILDLEKDIDELCSIKSSTVIDLITQGPKLLARSLNTVMSLPFATIIQFQKNIINFENPSVNEPRYQGINYFDKGVEDGKTLSIAYKNFNEKMSKIKFDISLLNLGQVTITNKPRSQTEYKNIFDAIFLTKPKILQDEVNKRVKFLNQKGVQISPEEKSVIEIDIINTKYVNQLNIVDIVYKDISEKTLFSDGYENIVYSTEYLDKLYEEIGESLNSANNIDIQDSPELLISYIDKLKEIRG